MPSQPHLHGIFESFAGQLHGASDDSANVDFLIMNEEQQTDFASDRPSEALFDGRSLAQSGDQFRSARLDESARQVLPGFSQFEGGKGSKVVEANFRVDF